ncbi:MAG: tetratricopeptide repeat protein [Acidiferrobacterales bacterium]
MNSWSLWKKNWAKAIYIGLMVFSNTVLASGETSFNQGLTAYRAGDYQRAAEFFEKARKQGLNKIAVYFNLGSSYYRLEEFDKAIPMFKQVIKSGQMVDIGNFNLGLIARKQDKNKLARQYFVQSISTSNNKKLIYLARKNIQEIDDRVGVWKSTVLANAGFNDNVSNTATGIAGGGDAYVTLAAYTRALISGSMEKGWLAHGELYNRSYSTITGYGLGSFSGGILRNTRLFGKNVYVGGYYKMQTLDSAPYQNIAGFESGIKTSTASGARYDYRYRFESVDAAATYSYLQGTRQRFRIQRFGKLGENSSLILTYRFEMNDRQNSSTASYTNIRHGIRASYYHTSANDVVWRVAARYRVSDYTPVATQDRFDNLAQFSIERKKKLKHDLEWTLKYLLSHNDSTDPAYSYSSNSFQVGLRKHF